jgi:hypothetical protein
MKIGTLLAGLIFLFAASCAFAHGNKVHVRGSIEKIASDSILVKTADGKSVEVKLVAATVFLLRSGNEDKPAKAGDLATGDLVVIHATPKGGTLEADEIKFSAPGKAKPATPASATPKS